MFFIRLFVVLILVQGYLCFKPADYCDLGCVQHGLYREHIACERKKCNPAPACKGYIKAPLTLQERKLIVDKHNELRSKLANGKEKGQPKASNMRELIYDRELEFIASCNANRCIFDHDQCRRTRELSVGQNIALRSSTAKPHKKEFINHHMNQISHWYNEVKHYNYSNRFTPAKKPGPETGHYTQIAWAEVERIGCARSVWTTGAWTHLYFVCNYGGRKTGGNLIGSAVYKKGEPCTKCPKKTKCSKKWSGLCEELVRKPTKDRKVPKKDIPKKDIPKKSHQKLKHKKHQSKKDKKKNKKLESNLNI